MLSGNNTTGRHTPQTPGSIVPDRTDRPTSRLIPSHDRTRLSASLSLVAPVTGVKRIAKRNRWRLLHHKARKRAQPVSQATLSTQNHSLWPPTATGIAFVDWSS